MANGGVIGTSNVPTTDVASGIWSLNESASAQRQSIWPTGLLSITGGTVTESNGYRYHTFKSSGTLTVSNSQSPKLCEFLLVGGGGGGGGGQSSTGSGGGGGIVHSTNWRPSSGALPIVVGGNSTAFDLTALAGGGGGAGMQSWSDTNRKSPGGSGGCGGTGYNAANGVSTQVKSYTTVNGDAIGYGNDAISAAGGAGGTAGQGLTFSQFTQAGDPNALGTYCSGGGTSYPGGGNTGRDPDGNGYNAPANSGGGGAGGSGSLYNGRSGGYGGSGAFIIRYPI